MKLNNKHLLIKYELINNKKYEDISLKHNVSLGTISKINSIDINWKEYKIEKAVIWVAGWGSRLMPVTKNLPKPLVIVKNITLLESGIRALHKIGIKDITIVTGRMREKFKNIIEKYEIKEIYNHKWEHHNNISSFYQFMKNIDVLKNTYLIDGDLFFHENTTLPKYLINSFMITSYVEKSKDLIIVKKSKWVEDYVNSAKLDMPLSGEQYKGVFALTKFDLEILRDKINSLYSIDDEYNSQYWFDPLFYLCKKSKIQMDTINYEFDEIIEIDNLSDLILVDKEKYKNIKYIKNNYGAKNV